MYRKSCVALRPWNLEKNPVLLSERVVLARRGRGKFASRCESGERAVDMPPPLFARLPHVLRSFLSSVDPGPMLPGVGVFPGVSMICGSVSILSAVSSEGEFSTRGGKMALNLPLDSSAGGICAGGGAAERPVGG